ncbi:uncharacterized protein [Parasteatoda tepidariorum]|uniref:uncharacterized protein n=1 Tax=Parasteatoda tepidariorum TaxID=114398 RepID=UPI0039BD42E3
MDIIEEDMKNDVKEDKKKLRQWILKAASTESGKSGISWVRIKKFVDSKQAGLAEKPEAKEILKKLIETGLIVKVNKNNYMTPKKKGGKKTSSKKKTKKTSAKKNTKKTSAKKAVKMSA